MRNIMICGHARHGKDSVCELLGFTDEITKDVVMDNIIWPFYIQEYGCKQDCYEDRANHRASWFRLISSFTEHDKTRLGKLIYEQTPVYCGVRRTEEFNALKEQGYFHLSIWVDASERLPPESIESNEITADMCDIVIPNNGTWEDLEHRVNNLEPFLLGLK